jgi:hypothetical protein
MAAEKQRERERERERERGQGQDTLLGNLFSDLRPPARPHLP